GRGQRPRRRTQQHAAANASEARAGEVRGLGQPVMRRFGALACAFALSGCEGVQNALGGQGAESANFIRLFTTFMVVCTVMYLIIGGALAVAVWRRRREALVIDDRRHHETSSKVGPALAVWTVLIVVGLTALTIASFFTDRSN